MSDFPVLSVFEPQVMTSFDADLGNGQTYPLTLCEATALTPFDYPGKQRDPFSLKFRGPGPGYLTQGLYSLRNDALGTQEIFLVPIGPDGDGFFYQAVFN